MERRGQTPWQARLLVVVALWLPLASVVGAEQAPSSASQTSGPQIDVASYQLNAVLDATTKQVHGSGVITYHNPSADTLSEIWLHLYLNAFRSSDTPWM